MIVLLYILIVILGFASFSAITSGHIFTGLILGALAYGCFQLIKVIVKKDKAKTDNLKDVVSNLCGGSMPRFSHFEKVTGIALNESKNEVVLVNEKGVAKSYPYTSIRDWSVKEEVAGKAGQMVVTGGGLAGGAQNAGFAMQAASQNAQMRREAEQNTGLFINVKDIDHPKWRISMQQKADRSRWFEILTQAINDGGLPA